MQTMGRTKVGNPQVAFKFDLEAKGMQRHFNTMELWTNYPLSFIVSYDGGWVSFDLDGEKWRHEMKDQELANQIIEILIVGYESKIRRSKICSHFQDQI